MTGMMLTYVCAFAFRKHDEIWAIDFKKALFPC